MNSKLNGHYRDTTALITGGSSGIGFALAKQLVCQGSNVWLLARNPDRLDAALRQLEMSRTTPRQQICALVGDVTQQQEIANLLHSFTQANGTPDLLINSAGAAHPGTFDALDVDIFEWMMAVNYFGTVNVTKSIISGMIERRSGSIINISSIAGFIGVYGYTAYGASKYAVRGFSDALRAELKPMGIKVSIVFPPDTETPQLEYENKFKPAVTKALGGSARALSPEQVAVSTLVAASKGKYIIIPGSEGQWMFRLSNMLGSLFYPVMDWLVAFAHNKTRTPKSRSDQ